MLEVLLRALALLCCTAGFAWLALSMESHWEQVRGAFYRSGYEQRKETHKNGIVDEIALGFDLVVVDGPYGKTTPFARYSALPFLKNKLADNFAVFLDDSSRIEEREIANEWLKLLQCKSVDKQRYTYFSSNTTFDVTPFGS